MKLTNKNYDMTNFELSRLTRLLLILRVHSIGDWELQIGLKDGLLNLGKLWVQHHFGADSVIINRSVALLRRCLNAFRRILIKLKRN